MRRRRSGRGHLSDLFYNTGDMNERTVNDSFGFSREFTDRTSQEMLSEERIEMKHKKEEEEQRIKDSKYPSCKVTDRPTGFGGQANIGPAII
jgi:hypothetical protein